MKSFTSKRAHSQNEKKKMGGTSSSAEKKNATALAMPRFVSCEHFFEPSMSGSTDDPRHQRQQNKQQLRKVAVARFENKFSDIAFSPHINSNIIAIYCHAFGWNSDAIRFVALIRVMPDLLPPVGTKFTHPAHHRHLAPPNATTFPRQGKLKFSPCGRFLFIVTNNSEKLIAWDLEKAYEDDCMNFANLDTFSDFPCDVVVDCANRSSEEVIDDFVFSQCGRRMFLLVESDVPAHRVRTSVLQLFERITRAPFWTKMDDSWSWETDFHLDMKMSLSADGTKMLFYSQQQQSATATAIIILDLATRISRSFALSSRTTTPIPTWMPAEPSDQPAAQPFMCFSEKNGVSVVSIQSLQSNNAPDFETTRRAGFVCSAPVSQNVFLAADEFGEQIQLWCINHDDGKCDLLQLSELHASESKGAAHRIVSAGDGRSLFCTFLDPHHEDQEQILRRLSSEKASQKGPQYQAVFWIVEESIQ